MGPSEHRAPEDQTEVPDRFIFFNLVAHLDPCMRGYDRTRVKYGLCICMSNETGRKIFQVLSG